MGAVRPKPQASNGTLDDLKGNKGNPRRISNEALSSLKDALLRFGDLGGIILNETTGQLVGGHQRVMALRQAMGEKDTKVHWQVTELVESDATGTTAVGWVHVIRPNGATRYAFRRVAWSKEHEAAANLAANRHGGEWEWERVSDILKKLPGDLRDLTGFGDGEIENLLGATFDSGTPGAMPTEPTQGHSIHFTLDQWEILEPLLEKMDGETNGEKIVRLCQKHHR